MDEIPRPPQNVQRSGSATPRKLRVIGKEPLAAVLDLAVSRALRRVSGAYDPAHVEEVQEVCRVEFRRLLKDNARPMRGVTKSQFLLELERSQHKMLAAKDKAQKELSELSERSELLRDRIDQEESSDEAFAVQRSASFEAELDKRFRKVLKLSDLGPASSRSLREALVHAAAEAAHAEWMKAREERRRQAEDEIQNYERRIAKLTGSLEKTEAELKRLASLESDADAGISSIYREVQGLDLEVQDAARKKEMLANIFQANLELQKSG